MSVQPIFTLLKELVWERRNCPQLDTEETDLRRKTNSEFGHHGGFEFGVDKKGHSWTAAWTLNQPKIGSALGQISGTES